MINLNKAREAQETHELLAEYIKEDLRRCEMSEPDRAPFASKETLEKFLEIAEEKAEIARKLKEEMAQTNLKTKF